VIPPVWNEFIKRKSEIPSVLPSDLTYGLVLPPDSTLPATAREDTKYIAAIEVEKIHEKLPEGFVGFSSPEGLYAVFEGADLNSLMSTMNQIYSEWLPASKYEARKENLLHIETYRGYGKDGGKDGDIKVDVAVPVMEKKE